MYLVNISKLNQSRFMFSPTADPAHPFMYHQKKQKSIYNNFQKRDHGKSICIVPNEDPQMDSLDISKKKKNQPIYKKWELSRKPRNAFKISRVYQDGIAHI